jgi:hypothetical protein
VRRMFCTHGACRYWHPLPHTHTIQHIGWTYIMRSLGPQLLEKCPFWDVHTCSAKACPALQQHMTVDASSLAICEHKAHLSVP